MNGLKNVQDSNGVVVSGRSTVTASSLSDSPSQPALTRDGPLLKTLHIAPMLHVSNREFRSFFRILSKKCTLWTEMVVDETLYYNYNTNTNLPRHLLDPVEMEDLPVICQLGAMSPEYSAVATRAVVEAGYHDEINLNMD